jgi:hypothetical protein
MCCCFTSSAATSCAVDHSNTGPVYSVDSGATVCLEPDVECPAEPRAVVPLPSRRLAFHLVLLLLGLYDLRILGEGSSREPCHKAQSILVSGHVPQKRNMGSLDCVHIAHCNGRTFRIAAHDSFSRGNVTVSTAVMTMTSPRALPPPSNSMRVIAVIPLTLANTPPI